MTDLLTATVSRDLSTVSITHDTDADWHKIREAHILLRDRINERLAAEDRCPFKPKGYKTTLDAARAVVRPQTTTPTPADPLENASERPRSAPTTPAATQAPPSHHERLENALRKAEELQEELRLLFPHKFQRNSTINVSMHNLVVNLRKLVQDSQA